MNKSELIKVIAEQTGITQKDTETVLKAFTNTVTETIISGEKVYIVGFGTFSLVDRAAREGHNPKTMEKISIPACKATKFKAAQALKDSINQ